MKRILAVSLPIIVVLLYTSVSRVPEGSVGVQSRGDALEVLRPEYRLHRPLAQPPVIYSLALPSVGDEMRITLADGASYEVGFDISGKIDPGRAAAFHKMALEKDPAAFLKEVGV